MTTTHDDAGAEALNLISEAFELVNSWQEAGFWTSVGAERISEILDQLHGIPSESSPLDEALFKSQKEERRIADLDSRQEAIRIDRETWWVHYEAAPQEVGEAFLRGWDQATSRYRNRNFLGGE